MWVKRRRYTLAWRPLTTMVAVSLVVWCQVGRGTLGVLSMAAEVYSFMAQAPATQGAAIDKPDGGTSITRGMEKEAIRTVTSGLTM